MRLRAASRFSSASQGLGRLLDLAVLLVLVVAMGAAATLVAKSWLVARSEMAMPSALISGPIGVCAGGNLATRSASCLVDGDTGWQAGVKWRLLAIDTPEIGGAECGRERRMALAARDRLVLLLQAGYRLESSGKTDRYGRNLVTIALADGRDAGAVLLSEGLAQPWPNRGNIWCGRAG